MILYHSGNAMVIPNCLMFDTQMGTTCKCASCDMYFDLIGDGFECVSV